MNRIAQKTALLILICSVVTVSHAQIVDTVQSPFYSIQQNGISNMAAIGDSLWIGPGLTYRIGFENQWTIPTGADSVTEGRGRLFSIALAPDTIYAGLGFSKETPQGGSVQTALGYYRSVNGGSAWDFIPFPTEPEDEDSLIYGGTLIGKVPVVVPEQSPPFDVAFRGDALFSANWASGILRSLDFGETWERLLLPPSTVDQLVPEDVPDFIFDPRQDNNFLGFGLEITSNGEVWLGTAGGLNISDNALTAPVDSVRWRRISYRPVFENLLSNWIIEIEENPATGTVWLTNWVANANQGVFGVTSTSDGGNTFRQHLEGIRVFDIAFSNGSVFAASNQGLFTSDDGGDTWQLFSDIRSPNTFIKRSAEILSLATTNERLFVGTSDGLASTPDGGQTWAIERVNFPLDGENQFQDDAPEVDAYAYPNPFSRIQHELVRIKYEVEEEGSVSIRLFDFGMNLIRELDSGRFSPGTYEAVWDGTDGQGRRVANGVIFYHIETAGGNKNGKILILD